MERFDKARREWAVTMWQMHRAIYSNLTALRDGSAVDMLRILRAIVYFNTPRASDAEREGLVATNWKLLLHSETPQAMPDHSPTHTRTLTPNPYRFEP